MQIDMLKILKMQKLKLSSKNQTNNNNGVNKTIAIAILTSLTFKFVIPLIMIPLKGDVLMNKNITKK